MENVSSDVKLYIKWYESIYNYFIFNLISTGLKKRWKATWATKAQVGRRPKGDSFPLGGSPSSLLYPVYTRGFCPLRHKFLEPPLVLLVLVLVGPS